MLRTPSTLVSDRNTTVNGFWIAGIAINLLALVAVAFWAVRAWRQADAARRPAGDASQGVDPDS